MVAKYRDRDFQRGVAFEFFRPGHGNKASIMDYCVQNCFPAASARMVALNAPGFAIGHPLAGRAIARVETAYKVVTIVTRFPRIEIKPKHSPADMARL